MLLKNKNKGMGLIEILLVIGFFSITISGVFVAFSKVQNDNNVEQVIQLSPEIFNKEQSFNRENTSYNLLISYKNTNSPQIEDLILYRSFIYDFNRDDYKPNHSKTKDLNTRYFDEVTINLPSDLQNNVAFNSALSSNLDLLFHLKQNISDFERNVENLIFEYSTQNNVKKPFSVYK